MKRERMYGMMAEFDSPTALVEAARTTYQAGYKKIDAYSPFPIEGLAEEIGADLYAPDAASAITTAGEHPTRKATVDQQTVGRTRRIRKAAARKGPGPVRDVTDIDSRLTPTRNGFIQGYNAQNMTSEDRLIIATELTQDTGDTVWFEPMLAQAGDAAALITAHQPPPAGATPATQASPAGQGSGIGQVLADAGYCSEHNLTIAGPDRLIATGEHRTLERTARQAAAGRGAAREEAADGPVAAMAARLATPEGITAYRKRGHIAETPHGQIKHNMGIRQLAMRGKPKASAEWRFTCTVHNLFKAITTGNLTQATLAALAS